MAEAESMELQPFNLERWLSLNPCKYDLASGGIMKLKLRDLIDEIDLDMLVTYDSTKGSETIRQEVADTFTNISSDNILITSGTAEANLLILYRLLKSGDEFVVLMPTYMQSVGLAKALDAKVKAQYLKDDENYEPNLEALKTNVTKKTKIIFLTNPNNPTGAILSKADLRAICEIAEDVEAYVVCDGALRGLEVSDEVAASPVDLYEKGFATGSLSKVGLSGIRIGWLAGDEELIRECWAYKDYTTLCHSGIGEFLATIALQRKNLSRYTERAKHIIRDHMTILSDWMKEHSQVVTWVPSRAGHTAFPKYSLDIDSVEFCRNLLREEEVSVAPGDFFGSPKHLRVRYSCEKETLKNGLEKLSVFLKRLTG